MLAALTLIVLLKWATIAQLPAWDTAMGLFPAAYTLAGNGFDLPALLQMPGYLEGGPNTHSMSSVTLLTGAFLMLFGGGTGGFVVLHLLHLAVAALSLVMLRRFAQPVLGTSAAWLLCLSVLLSPLFSAQVGRMYMEIPLFLCAVSALLAWDRGKFGTAILWATLALTVKETGIIVSVALVVATILENRPLRVRMRRALLVVGPPAVWLVLTSLLSGVVTSGGEFGGFLRFRHYLSRFLFNVPDLLAFIAVFLVAAIAWRRDIVKALRPVPPDVVGREPEWRGLRALGLSGILISCFLRFFFVDLPVAAHFTIVLPRYYVVILPFLLLWVGYAAQRILGNVSKAPAQWCFVLLCIFFGFNSEGRLYPLDIDTEGPGNDYPLTERSNAYMRLDEVQRQAVQYLERMPEGVPIYYGHYEHYLFTYPELGYTTGPLRDGRSLSLEEVDESILQGSSPGCLYFLFNYPWLGGEKMLRFLSFVDTRADLVQETVRQFTDGRYKISLIRVRGPLAECPAQPQAN